MTIEDRLLAKLVDRPDGCRVFTGATDAHGYGLLWDSRRRNNSRAHRIAYELWVGPIPDGHDVHHECRVRACCNPRHLLTVESGEHNSGHHRKTECRKGHPFTPENTAVRRGQQVCLTCARASTSEWAKRNRESINRRKRERHRAAREAQG